MRTKRLFLCSLAVGFTLCFPFSVYGVSANTAINNSDGLNDTLNITFDGQYYNPYNPFSLYFEEYWGNGVYGVNSVEFPRGYGMTYSVEGNSLTRYQSNGIDYSYDNRSNDASIYTNFYSLYFALECHGTALMGDYLDNIRLVVDDSCLVHIWCEYYNTSHNNAHFNGTYTGEWVDYSGDSSIMLGDIFGFMLDNISDISVYTYNSIFVKTLTFYFEALGDDITFVKLIDESPTAASRCTLTRGYAVQANVTGSPPVADPVDTFSFLGDSIKSFLDTDILPNFSLGDLILLCLGITVFGIGLKIAFGG